MRVVPYSSPTDGHSNGIHLSVTPNFASLHLPFLSFTLHKSSAKKLLGPLPNKTELYLTPTLEHKIT